MKAEEAVSDLPGGDERLTSLEEGRQPRRSSNMSIKRREHVVHHPEDRLAAPGLTEIIALTGMLHLLDGQVSGSDEGRKEIEVVCTAGLDHRHRGNRETDALPDIGRDGIPKGLEGVLKQESYFHVLNKFRPRISRITRILS